MRENRLRQPRHSTHRPSLGTSQSLSNTLDVATDFALLKLERRLNKFEVSAVALAAGAAVPLAGRGGGLPGGVVDGSSATPLRSA